MMTSEQEHQRRAAEPMYWFNKSSDLQASAGALWYCMEHKTANIPQALGLGSGFDMTVATWPVYRMICGMCLELAYKAICVAQGQKVVTTHDLLKLAHLAGIPLSGVQDEQMLAFLSECIVWDGRYPVPKSHEKAEYFAHLTYDRFFSPEKTRDRSYVLRPIVPHPLDWPQFDPLWRQAVAAFELSYGGSAMRECRPTN